MGGGGDLWPRNDVPTTYKAVTLLCGQRIMAIFSTQGEYFRSKKRADRGNKSIIERIISWLFVFLAYRICPLVPKLQNTSDSHCNRVFWTDNKARWTIDRVFAYIIFARRGPDMEIIEVMMLRKIPGSESVTEINRKYFYSRELYISSLSFIHPE